MKCCVPGCKNDSKHVSKLQGITFHVFPADPEVRTSWISAINRRDWQPKDQSAVCSNHFYFEDLYETRSGLRKVRSGAVPFVNANFQDITAEKMTFTKVCRICLISTNKVYSMNQHNLDMILQNLTGIVIAEDKLPQTICGVCAYKLLSYDSFKHTTIQANNILIEEINKGNCVCKYYLSTQNVDQCRQFSSQRRLLLKRKKINPSSITTNYNHLSKLSITPIKPDFYNNYYTYTEENECEPEIKNEQIIDNEDSIDNIEPIDNIETTDNTDIDNVETTENIFVNEITKYSDSYNDMKEFDSEDSLPLLNVTQRKKKVLKIKKKETKIKIDRRKKPFLSTDLNETLFNVIDLTYEEQIAEIEKRQESDNYKHAVYRCTECYKGFLDQDAYNTHMVRHTNESGDHRCTICKTHFKTQNALRKHMTAHHSQRFSCKQCVYETTHRQTARLHERWHRGTKYTCPHCRDEFLKFSTYMGHIRIKHPSDFVCGLCGFSFVSAKGIDLHKKLKHINDIPIPPTGPYCDLCSVRFLNEEAYQNHISISPRHENKSLNVDTKSNKKKAREMKERPVKSTDDEESRKLCQLRKVEGPLPCEQCGLQLEDSRAYHGHFRRMHPDKNRTLYPSMKSPCMCEVCGRIFQSYALLKDHTWTHTGERPFKCDDCGKSFRMKQRLVSHRRVHSSVKTSFVCSVCGKHFSSRSNRQRHMSIHTGLKPFKCEMCGKAFKHGSEKRAHITYVHLKKPWPKRSRGKRSTRQGSVPPTSQNQEMELPMWSCDKMADINNIMDDKPMYYNIKL